jgi:hypothetical protein
MQVLNLVLLTHQVALHELSYTLAGMWAVERSPKSVESSHSLRDPLCGLVTGAKQPAEEHGP